MPYHIKDQGEISRFFCSVFCFLPHKSAATNHEQKCEIIKCLSHAVLSLLAIHFFYTTPILSSPVPCPVAAVTSSCHYRETPGHWLTDWLVDQTHRTGLESLPYTNLLTEQLLDAVLFNWPFKFICDKKHLNIDFDLMGTFDTRMHLYAWLLLLASYCDTFTVWSLSRTNAYM